jgi:ribonuclease HII
MTGARIAGVDEAGRGPLAGPVVAACVVLDPARPIAGLADSKTLGGARRDALSHAIRERALAWAVASASVEEIDAMNILQATLLAMRRAVLSIDPLPDEVLVDGNRCPPLPCATRAVVRGDATVASISAASILAKTARDALMDELHGNHPGYGFDHHRGYPTPDHLAALARLGPSGVHRRSFAPVRAALAAMARG